MVEGDLRLRDAEEAHPLENPTFVSATVDAGFDGTGAITAGTLATPAISIEQEITEPLDTTVYIDASFSQVTPANLTGTIDHLGDLILQASLTVDLDIEVSRPALIAAQCRSTPVVLTLESTAPYDPETKTVTLADHDFTIPSIPDTPACQPTALRDEVNAQLTGPGHAITLVMEGELELPPDQDAAETVTELAVAPEETSRLGEAVTLTATVAPGEATEETGPPAGFVDFMDDGDVLATSALDGTGTATFTTSTLAAGTYAFTARYRGQAPFGRSSSETWTHLVAADPTLTSSLPDLVPYGGDGVEFDVVARNPSLGVPLQGVGIDVHMKRPGGQLGPNGVVIERRDATGAWVSIPLELGSAGGSAVAYGSVGPAGGAPLGLGETRTEHLRLSVVAADPAIAPGPIAVTFNLVQAVADEEPRLLATTTSTVTIIETERRPSTVNVGNPFVPGLVPAVVRSGNTVLLRNITLGPVVAGSRPTGRVSFLLDGQPVLVRARDQPFEDGFVSSAPSNTSIELRIPAGTRPGPHEITTRYLGNDNFLPSHTTSSFTVVAAAGPVFECRANTSFDRVYTFNLVGLASLPTTRVSGTEVPVSNLHLEMLFDRGASVQDFQAIFGPGLSEVGPDDGDLHGIDLEFGPSGSGSAAAIEVTNSSFLTSAGGDPDLGIDLKGETGSVTIEGAPGDVVPVTLDRIVVRTVTNVVPIPYDLDCRPLEGPVVLGSIVVAGTTLTVDAPAPTRIGDDVTLTATVAPVMDGTTVEFSDGDTTIGIAPVVDGQAVLVVDDLAVGDRSLTALHRAGTAVASSTSASVSLRVLPALQCADRAAPGNGAVVRLVYLELLGRCPDAAGYAFWRGLLDAGTSPEAFARSIASTPEAVGRVVDDAYRTMLDRPADAAGRAFWTQRLLGHGRYDTLLADLGASPEFWAKAGSTNTGFVTRVYDRLLGRAPEQTGLDYWVGRLDTGTSPRVLIVQLANLDEPLGVLVTDSYGEILDRAPDSGERTAGIGHLRTTGDRSGLYAQLIGTGEFDQRAQGFPGA